MYMPVKVFYHVFCNAHTMTVVRDQVTKVLFSGLYDTADVIYCCLAGEPEVIQQVQVFLAKSGAKFKVIKLGVNDTTYERFTLTAMPHYVTPVDKVFYFHSKGVTKTESPMVDNIRDWRTYMEFFMMSRHLECLALLETHDTVGVSLRNEPALHYCGNFWWCRGDYFLTLDTADLMASYWDSTYLAPEMWICTKRPRAVNLFSSFRDMYFQEFPTGQYVDQKGLSYPKDPCPSFH